MIRRLLCIIVTVGAVASVITSAHAADPIRVPGKIDSVTVYRGQALVTRLVDVTAPAGQVDVVVTDLPDRVIGRGEYGGEARGAKCRASPT